MRHVLRCMGNDGDDSSQPGHRRSHDPRQNNGTSPVHAHASRVQPASGHHLSPIYQLHACVPAARTQYRAYLSAIALSN